MAQGLLRGCALIPKILEDDVFRVLKVSDEALPAEMKVLRKKLRSSGATYEDILNFENCIRTFRRVKRLEIGTIEGLDDAGRALIERLDVQAWRSVFDYAAARVGFYAKKPTTAIGSVKGILAEKVFDVSPAFAEVMARAQARGLRLGISPGDIRHVNGLRGITLSEKSAKFLNHGEITDGLIKGVRRIDLSAGERALREAERGRYIHWGVSKRGNLAPLEEDVHILTLKESKSPSNVQQIGADHGENWLGQMGNDMERFLELPSFIDGKWYTPLQVRLSIYRTEWVAVVPKGMPLSLTALERLSVKTATRPYGRLFRMYELEIVDDVMNMIAERMLKLLAGKL